MTTAQEISGAADLPQDKTTIAGADAAGTSPPGNLQDGELNPDTMGTSPPGNLDDANLNAGADAHAQDHRQDQGRGLDLEHLRTDGPTLEEFTAAGYPADKYPPRGYAKREAAKPADQQHMPVRSTSKGEGGRMLVQFDGPLNDASKKKYMDKAVYRLDGYLEPISVEQVNPDQIAVMFKGEIRDRKFTIA